MSVAVLISEAEVGQGGAHHRAYVLNVHFRDFRDFRARASGLARASLGADREQGKREAEHVWSGAKPVAHTWMILVAGHNTRHPAVYSRETLSFSTRPFAQVLLGGVHAGNEFGSISHFAWQPGGGIDVRVTDALAIRVQTDLRPIPFDTGTPKQWRIASGVVLSK
jgi:hypothetical protein